MASLRFPEFASFLARIVGECVVVLRLSSDRHFRVGFVVLAVYVSSYLSWCGLLHVLLLRVHLLLRIFSALCALPCFCLLFVP